MTTYETRHGWIVPSPTPELAVAAAPPADVPRGGRLLLCLRCTCLAQLASTPPVDGTFRASITVGFGAGPYVTQTLRWPPARQASVDAGMPPSSGQGGPEWGGTHHVDEHVVVEWSGSDADTLARFWLIVGGTHSDERYELLGWHPVGREALASLGYYDTMHEPAAL